MPGQQVTVDATRLTSRDAVRPNRCRHWRCCPAMGLAPFRKRALCVAVVRPEVIAPIAAAGLVTEIPGRSGDIQPRNRVGADVPRRARLGRLEWETRHDRGPRRDGPRLTLTNRVLTAWRRAAQAAPAAHAQRDGKLHRHRRELGFLARFIEDALAQPVQPFADA